MYLKNSNGKKKPVNSAINSAALQDHFMRQFNYNLMDTFSATNSSHPHNK